MFVSLFAPLVLMAAQLSIPLGKTPRQVEWPRAPIETMGPRWAAQCAGKEMDWDAPAPPVRIHGNTYLVGTCGIAAILITDPSGHILIDGGTEKGAEVIAANIRALAFRVEDVRYIIHSHEHFDHVGGVARLQQLSGATLVASAPAAKVFATGAPTADDPQAGMHEPFRAATVGRIIADGGEIRTRDNLIQAMATPGHTAGAMSWRWNSCDGGVCRMIVYADSLSPVSRDDYKFSAHPAWLSAFRASIAKVAASPCEIVLTPHPISSDMPKRLAAGKPLFDADGCKTYAAGLTKKLDERLAKERAGK